MQEEPQKPKQNYHLMKTHLLATGLVTTLLLGCSTDSKPVPPVIISNNGQKDSYIEKVEQIVSESASALTAVAPSIPAGVPREIIEGQITRLSGISKASVEKVKEFERMVKEKDFKAVEKDKEKAAKVDEETNKLWAIVEEQNQQIALEQAMRETAELQAREERKTRVVFQASSASLALLVFGILVTAFSPWKKAGAIVIALSVISFGALWWLLS
jgi:hypothetical protein